LCDLAAVAFEFGEHGCALECLHPRRERTRCLTPSEKQTARRGRDPTRR
jgi:hypothetical protein